MAIDYDLLSAEPYDPCLLLRTFRPIYLKMLAEPGVQRVTFRDRTTEFQKADSTALANLMRQWSSDCAAKTGGPRTNFAITAGAGSGCNCRTGGKI